VDEDKDEEGERSRSHQHLKSASRKEVTSCELAHAPLARHCAAEHDLHPPRKQISETDRLASSAVARLRPVRVVLLP
jgi:hypothetical protein